MKSLHIQVQVQSDSRSIARLLSALLRLPLVRDIKITKGPQSQEYTNIDLRIRSVRLIWAVLSEAIQKDRILSRKTIVAVEGKNGWNDYELLFHWRPEKIDKKWRKMVQPGVVADGSRLHFGPTVARLVKRQEQRRAGKRARG
jgi:hypothetical protein